MAGRKKNLNRQTFVEPEHLDFPLKPAQTKHTQVFNSISCKLNSQPIKTLRCMGGMSLHILQCPGILSSRKYQEAQIIHLSVFVSTEKRSDKKCPGTSIRDAQITQKQLVHLIRFCLPKIPRVSHCAVSLQGRPQNGVANKFF